MRPISERLECQLWKGVHWSSSPTHSGKPEAILDWMKRAARGEFPKTTPEPERAASDSMDKPVSQEAKNKEGHSN